MSRVPKTHPRIEAYGDVDELNAHSACCSHAPGCPSATRAWLRRIQNDLFDVGADLSVPHGGDRDAPARRARADGVARGALRRGQRASCRALRSFLLPGGTPAAAQLHVCRTVCRRAERRALPASTTPTPRSCATSTGSRTCSSSSPGRRTPARSRSGSPALAALPEAQAHVLGRRRRGHALPAAVDERVDGAVLAQDEMAVRGRREQRVLERPGAAFRRSTARRMSRWRTPRASSAPTIAASATSSTE